MTQLEILPRPPDLRADSNPWPQWSLILRTSSAHEEGGERVYSVNTERFVDDGTGKVRALRLHEVELLDGRFTKIEGSEHEIPADIVLLAMGFVGPERASWLDQLGVTFDQRGNVTRDDSFMTNGAGGVRGRRHGTRAEPHRVGHRRGPCLRRGRRRVPRRRDHAAGADRSDRPPAHLTTRAAARSLTSG